MALSRRDAMKFTGLAAVTAAASGYAKGNESPKSAAKGVLLSPAPIPAAKGPRVVIVGAGPSGLTIAKYVKKGNPNIDVVLMDKRSVFMSGFISNLVATGILPLEFITHDFLEGARNGNYTFLQATAHEIDRTAKVVYTNEGTVKYDVLVLAPGIDYDYSKWTNGDVELENTLKTKFPGAFIAGSETLSLKSKIENFEGGVFVQTVPGGNYRCLPGPYERSCLIADYMKRNKIKGKVVILDENPNITIKADGFHSAFEKLYKDYITYMPSSTITSIDPHKQKIVTELGEEIDFTDAALYSRVRGNKLLEIAGVAKDSVFNKAEANIDPFTYQVIGDLNVFCTGDVRPMGFSKSANTANTEARVVAANIVKYMGGQELSQKTWTSPHTTCYSAVESDPLRAISVNAGYAYDETKKSFGFANASTMEKWDSADGLAAGKGLIEWGNGLYRDFFN
ncbi:MAG: FAD/NAD(P)-binding oxidoreductase [Sulfuricurvum sp.]|uniref:FAD-dependent oxidoreductase n=1 Tax=Sulfuricurvum sp. TaxID=2025608 RepID=UPI002626E436|nr:FAD/NAD(P)-binding oxidoreductase [Sulfuricurvum sp.]MDD2951340.1 FAD/NAD(P)-binding oxidoreductase [Sulfuricurvum sp.]MDD5118049.1 FAD/NAD(P)-binding oxidoreductase [Sulfuricurvum sp.]